jgi:hypothetical protein
VSVCVTTCVCQVLKCAYECASASASACASVCVCQCRCTGVLVLTAGLSCVTRNAIGFGESPSATSLLCMSPKPVLMPAAAGGVGHVGWLPMITSDQAMLSSVHRS